MNRTIQVLKYIISDFLAASLAWAIFFVFRKYYISQEIFDWNIVFSDQKFYLGIIIMPTSWLIFYVLMGTYRKIYRKSRLQELGQTLLVSFIGTTIIFFTLILDDIEFLISYKGYYQFVIVLFVLHFTLTFLGRFILSSITAHKIHNRIIGFPTLIIGSNGNATSIYKEIEGQEKSSGNKFIGFVHVNGDHDFMLEEYLPHLGHYKDIKQIIQDHGVEEIIIAIDPEEHRSVFNIITELQGTGIVIKVIPDMHDILLGSVKMTSIFHAPLIHIYPDIMPAWQQSTKRILDIVVSIFALILLTPVYLLTALIIKLSSKGPVFYSHERVGLHGRSFTMHKFRSMYQDAETNGPQLSSENDPRITPFGRFMRQVRLDETPQFWNVLIGDMSLVGYRPERQYYIDQIVKEAPHYRLLFKIKPGITSWGQVKFGYAENVDEMIQRLKYDILYLENMSLATDFKIMIYTVLIVMLGRGK
jgi:exopolysaccharide biosynthesis polyprenyl glycosylphosphotransferase